MKCLLCKPKRSRKQDSRHHLIESKSVKRRSLTMKKRTAEEIRCSHKRCNSENYANFVPLEVVLEWKVTLQSVSRTLANTKSDFMDLDWSLLGSKGG